MHEGRIYKNSQGRYQLENSSYYWTSGDYMEVYDPDINTWLKGRVEYGDHDYYWTDDKDSMPLYNGMLVRAE